MKKANKKWCLISILVILFTICCADLALAQSATSGALIEKDSGTRLSALTQQRALFSTGGNGYLDSAGGNVDFKLEVCGSGLSGYTAGIAYLVAPNAVGKQQSFLIAMVSNGSNFAPLSGPNAGCFATSDAYNINSGLARYPAKAFAVVDLNGNGLVDTTDLIINMSANGFLGGSFSSRSSTVTLETNYVQTTGMVNSIGPGGSAQVDICTDPNLPPNCGSFGSASTSKIDASLVMGICTDAAGLTCSDTTKRTLGSANSNLNTSIVNPTDHQIFWPYFVINGIGYSFCIGPDVKVTGVSANPPAGAKGTLVNLTASVRNNKNVDVTTSFTVEFWVSGANVCNGTITNSAGNKLLAFNANTKTTSCIWDTSSVSPGVSTITGRPKHVAAGVADCYDPDDGYGTWSTQRFWSIVTDIDQTNNTNVFNDTGRPYNLTVHVNNTDGLPIDVEVRITEENGMGNVFAPFQINVSPTSTVSRAMGSVRTQGSIAKLAVVPTGSKAHYAPEFAYLNAASYVGNYSIYIELFDQSNPNTELPLFINNSAADKYYFVINNPIPRTPTAAEEDGVEVFNNNVFKQLFGLILGPWSDGTKWLK